MFRPFKSAQIAALACVTLTAIGTSAGPAAAQQKQTPLFFDARRLPDMEVERRNQEVLAEQRRAAEERRVAEEANAKRLAGEAKAQEARIAAEAAAKKKAEEARLAASEAEVKKKADEARLAAAEAEAKKKADEARLAAAEAEVKKKADEVRLAAAEAEAKRKADEARLAAAEAEVKKKADELRLAAAEAEAKRRADEEKRLAAANSAATSTQRAQPQVAALAPQVTSPPSPGATCEPTKAKPSHLAGGRMRIAIDSPCRKGQSVSLRYGGYELIRKLDNAGHAAIDLDLFQGKTESIGLAYPDGHTESLQPAARDLAEVWKVALIWQAPVDLDLHAMENGALNGKPGHIWSGAAGTAEAAKAQSTDSGRGAGFISMSDDGSHEGTKIEVYTFFHTTDQPNGVVSMLLDYVTRGNNPSGDYCGTGAKASIPYEAVMLSPKGITSRERGTITPAACGAAIAPSARLIRDAIPDLQFGQ